MTDNTTKKTKTKKTIKKSKGGAPKKYKTAEELQKKIDAYFEDCDIKEKPYTVTGLALACNLSREQLINYSKDKEFYDTIKKAKMRVLENLESRLYDKKTFTPGIIFGLKNNYGWKDAQQLEHTGTITIGLADKLREARERVRGAKGGGDSEGA